MSEFIEATIIFNGSEKTAVFNIDNIDCIYEDKQLTPVPKTATYIDTGTRTYEVKEKLEDLCQKLPEAFSKFNPHGVYLR